MAEPRGSTTATADVTVTELVARFRAGTSSPVEHLQWTLARIEALDPALGAFLTVAPDQALAQAGAAERIIREQGADAWRDRPLLGVPVAVKDLTPTRGIRTTRGSRWRAERVPTFDAPAVARLRRAGAIIVGKTNTSEYGWSGASLNRLAGPTRNPWRPELTAGGSSGGSAAAVAAGLCPAAIGTDGAGSIRIPAAFCGVVGFKPSFGRIPYAPTSPENLSHCGPLTRSVTDAALLTSVMAGADPADRFSLADPWQDPVLPDRPLRVAWIDSLGAPEPDPELNTLARSAVTALAGCGHRLTAIGAPFPDPYPALVAILAAAEAAGHAAEPGFPDELADPGRLEVIALGRRLSAVRLATAERERAELWARLHRTMAQFDLLATATVPVTPFPAERHHPVEPVDKGEHPWLAWTPATYPFNLTGQPAISVPAGFTTRGLPAAVQLVGGWRADAVVLAAAQQLEAALGRPPEFGRGEP